MPLLQIKNSFIIYVIIHEIFEFGQCCECLSELSKLLKFKDKVYSYLVLSLIIGNEFVRLGSMSR